MAGSHGHTGSNGHHGEVNPTKLLLATVLNLLISVAEVGGGLLSGSLALFSDALHNLGDAFATLIAFLAIRISGKKSSVKRTFGLKRIEIMAALINAVILVGLSIYLFIEAFQRLKNPVEIKSTIMMVVAMIGLLANVYAVILLRKESKKSINVKAAYTHLIGDSLSSVVVIIGGLAIMLYEVYWVDPVITFLIGIYILKETFTILKESVNILMQKTPENMNIREIKKDIEKIELVENVHHIHSWGLTDRQIFFESHIDVFKDMKISEANRIRQQIEEMLKRKHGITHVTLQFEYKVCDDKAIVHPGE